MGHHDVPQIAALATRQSAGKAKAEPTAAEADRPMPWEAGHALRSVPVEPGYGWQHVVYGGTYPLSAVRDTLLDVFGESDEDHDGRMDGESALFALTVTDEGRLLLDSPVFSTCAWATGRAVTPGPGIFYVAARTLAGGRAEGVASSFGTGLGGMVHVFAGSLGVSAVVLASAELFDRTTNTWSTTNAMPGARQLHGAVLLGATGNTNTANKALITGGWNGTASQSTSFLYDATAGTWTTGATLGRATST